MIENIEEILRGVMSDQLGVPREKILLESNFKTLGADSLDMIEGIMAVEEAFGIEIPDEVADEIKTFGDLVEKVKLIKVGKNG
jgi:acyl carrier protein